MSSFELFDHKNNILNVIVYEWMVAYALIIFVCKNTVKNVNIRFDIDILSMYTKILAHI